MKRRILGAQILLDPAATLSQRAASMRCDERHACGPKPDCCAECGMDGPAGVDDKEIIFTSAGVFMVFVPIFAGTPD